eukprot:TRINITY_DN118_c0_g1_i1.p1 TRINITY_DN118_c0_g1~~TRINITY_DN118_c0_g1_i1.p1  ORF type:complete len:219 (-),score=39.00 TRINITY_DN118_c0_g1_i1:24-680(-)
MGHYGNKAIHDNHFRKHWQERVKTWFNQPARKQRRRAARAEKARHIFPRPIAGAIRPVVHPQSRRYNFSVRAGRGFTLEEIKGAGIVARQAQSIGIAVDYRRRNRSEKSLKLNVQRLKNYKSKLVLFPRNPAKPQAGDASKEDLAKVQQFAGAIQPTKRAVQDRESLQSVKSSEVDFKTSAFTTLKVARTNARLIGVREVRKKKKADEAALAAAKAAK